MCNVKLQCKEVKKDKFMSVIMLLIKRHVSAYSEAIIRFNNFQLYETYIIHGIELLDVDLEIVEHDDGLRVGRNISFN